MTRTDFLEKVETLPAVRREVRLTPAGSHSLMDIQGEMGTGRPRQTRAIPSAAHCDRHCGG